MPNEAQAKLLRFLQTMTYTPLGAIHPVEIDVRVIAATNRRPDLGDGSGLRLDLAARLGAHPVSIPALRNRVEDIVRLAAHFLGSAAAARPFQVAAFRKLCLYRWPGNVRQLEKVITEAMVLSEGHDRIGLDHLPDALSSETALTSSPDCLADPPRSRRPAPSRELLEQLLTKHRGNVAHVARELDRKWGVVWRCIVRSGIDVDRFRKS
jgi:transcriptional regulator with PAS, ATPase and Fis domain